MTVPTREQAAQILVQLGAAKGLVRHSATVAEIAAFLAERLRERGRELPPDLVETAALLHDIDKTPPLRALRGALGHGWAGASWLAGRGHEELGAAILNHPASRLTDDDHYRVWQREASLAERVVAYADKRAMLDIVPLAERYAEWQRRRPDRSAEIAQGKLIAEGLEREICQAAGIEPADVGRLPWVDAALAAAQPVPSTRTA